MQGNRERYYEPNNSLLDHVLINREVSGDFLPQIPWAPAGISLEPCCSCVCKLHLRACVLQRRAWHCHSVGRAAACCSATDRAPSDNEHHVRPPTTCMHSDVQGIPISMAVLHAAVSCCGAQGCRAMPRYTVPCHALPCHQYAPATTRHAIIPPIRPCHRTPRHDHPMPSHATPLHATP